MLDFLFWLTLAWVDAKECYRQHQESCSLDMLLASGSSSRGGETQEVLIIDELSWGRVWHQEGHATSGCSGSGKNNGIELAWFAPLF